MVILSVMLSLDMQFLTVRGIKVPGVRGQAVQEQCLLYPEGECTTLLQNSQNYMSSDTAPDPRRLKF